MKQADSSLLFPLLLKALGRCVSPRVYTIHKILTWTFAYMAIYMYHRIDQDILSRKSSHKDTPISVLFWTFLFGKLINSVISSGPSSAAAEIIVDVYRYTYHLNKSLQGFVQRKLDTFKIK